MSKIVAAATIFNQPEQLFMECVVEYPVAWLQVVASAAVVGE